MLLYVVLVAGCVCNVAVSQRDCAFIPDDITVTNDTVITVDCHARQPAVLADNKLTHVDEHLTRVVVYFSNCVTVPVGLFVNASSRLSVVTLVSNDSEVLAAGTFEGLGNIVELRLEGFQTLQSLNSTVFRPLRHLQRLILVGFGAHTLSYAKLGVALGGLSGTPLRRIVMHEIHSIHNEKALEVASLFTMRNVTIRELVFSNNFVTSISGNLSQTLRHLNYICVAAKALFYSAMNPLLDAWLFLPNITEMFLYAYPVPDSQNPIPFGSALDFGNLDLAIKVVLLRHLLHKECYSTLQLPLTLSLRRLIVRNLQLLDPILDKPICFDSTNNIEYVDFAGSPLPTSSLRITGLNRLKHFDMQNTGITALPGDFLQYFPRLESINLVQLSIADWMGHINESFFGNCPTLKKIHLGNCMLTTIPSAAFVHLPALEVLNLSSNSLQSFDVSFSNGSRLLHLNLSDNALWTLSEDVLLELSEVAQRRLQTGEMLTVDLSRNRLSCLCNSIHVVRQLQDWVINREVSVSGFDEYTCLYSNGTVVAMSVVDVRQSVTDCRVLNEFQNASDCPCDDDLRQRLQRIRMSLQGYFCRDSSGEFASMVVFPLPSCPHFFSNPKFIASVVVGVVLILAVVITTVVLYRYRKTEPVHRLIQHLSMNRIVRLGIQHVLARNREDPSSFTHDVFLYIADTDQDATGRLFDRELCPCRHVLRHDDFSVGLKLETLLERMQTCRWLVPVMSPNFVDDGECCDFIARAQYTRPHAIVPVVWTPFGTQDLTINSLLDTAEPVTWPGDQASNTEKTSFWDTLLERTADWPSDIHLL